MGSSRQDSLPMVFFAQHHEVSSDTECGGSAGFLLGAAADPPLRHRVRLGLLDASWLRGNGNGDFHLTECWD
ncbi:hypothetical protein U1Q18_026514 [Sarracenia purpurea var. burkii]